MPAACARATTSAISEAKSGKSRCACVSKNVAIPPGRCRANGPGETRIPVRKMERRSPTRRGGWPSPDWGITAHRVGLCRYAVRCPAVRTKSRNIRLRHYPVRCISVLQCLYPRFFSIRNYCFLHLNYYSINQPTAPVRQTSPLTFSISVSVWSRHEPGPAYRSAAPRTNRRR